MIGHRKINLGVYTFGVRNLTWDNYKLRRFIRDLQPTVWGIKNCGVQDKEDIPQMRVALFNQG